MPAPIQETGLQLLKNGVRFRKGWLLEVRTPNPETGDILLQLGLTLLKPGAHILNHRLQLMKMLPKI
jgi:hypothetical protein